MHRIRLIGELHTFLCRQALGGLGDARAQVQVGQHVIDHGIQIKRGLPAPIFLCHGVVDRLGPAVSDGLPKVGGVVDGEIWDVAANHRCDLRWRKTRARQVVRTAFLN